MRRLGGRWIGLGLALAVGCGGSGSGAGAPGSRPPTAGHVLFRNRVPPSLAYVKVTGCAEQAVAPDGSFDTTCAGASFDVAVTYSNVGVVYRGLNRRDPVVTLPFALGGRQEGSTSGKVTGLTAGRASAVAVTSATIAAGFSPTSNGAFSEWLQWSGVPPAATVRALEWTPATGLPASFTGYAAAPVALQDRSDVPASPALGAVGSGAIAVTSDAADVTALAYGLWATWPDGGVTEIASATPAAPAVTVAAPDVTGVEFAVLAERGSNPTAWGWRRGLAATSSPATIALPSPPVFTGPAPGAAVTATTDFTFAGLPNAVYLVAFEATAGAPLLYVVTRETSVRIPDFQWAGLTLPSGTGLTAKVQAMGPCASMDDAAASTDPLSLLPAAWEAAERIPAVDGFASAYSMTVSTP